MSKVNRAAGLMGIGMGGAYPKSWNPASRHRLFSLEKMLEFHSLFRSFLNRCSTTCFVGSDIQS